MTKIKFLYVFLFYFSHSLLMEKNHEKSIRYQILSYRHKKKTIGVGILASTAMTLFFRSNKERNNLFNPFSPERIREINKKDIFVSFSVGLSTGFIGYLFFKPCLHRDKTHHEVKQSFERIKNHLLQDSERCYLSFYKKKNDKVENFLQGLCFLIEAWNKKKEFSQKDYQFIYSAKNKINVINKEMESNEQFTTNCNINLLEEAIEYVGKNYKKECICEGRYQVF